MEKRERKLSLQGILRRYLLHTVAGLAIISLLWWMGLVLLINKNFVYSASQAALSLETVAKTVQGSGRDVGEHIPHLYRWVLVDANGQVMETTMNQRIQEEALGLGSGERMVRDFPYSRYYKKIFMDNGTVCILEYDYSMVYVQTWMQEHLPDFQTCALLVLILVCICFIVRQTKHYTKILKADAQKLQNAAAVIREHKLDQSLERKASVKELNEVLDSMEELRASLADSFSRQWMMEQRQSEELAALSHDLKTPLTIIQGNADLLEEEEALTKEQREQVRAISGSAEHIQEYMKRLKELSVCAWESDAMGKEYFSLKTFAGEVEQAGQSVCGPRGVKFHVCPVSDEELLGEKNILFRAVMNLIDNGARYTPRGRTVEFEVLVREGMAVLQVRDEGPGFSQEALLKGGNIFYTSDQGRPREGHMGLGLKFASEAARCHGGSLRLYNTRQGGCAELILGAQLKQIS